MLLYGSVSCRARGGGKLRGKGEWQGWWWWWRWSKRVAAKQDWDECAQAVLYKSRDAGTQQNAARPGTMGRTARVRAPDSVYGAGQEGRIGQERQAGSFS